MKGIRGLLEKDFRLFLRQGGNLFLVLAVVAIFFILTGKMGADFIAVYIPSVMAVYSGNTISSIAIISKFNTSSGFISVAIPAQITPIHHPHTVIIKDKIYFSLTYIFLFTGKENKYVYP